MTERVALITGSGSGVGRAVALGLANQGYRVALVGRRSEALEETVSLAEAEADKLLVCPADVCDRSSVESAFAKAVARFGRLDVLFNNAGIFSVAGVDSGPEILEDLNVDAWRKVIDVNVTGSFLCAQQAIRIMKGQTPRGGRIINNGSIAAYSPRPNSAAYTTSKHAVTGLTKAIALDGRKYDIACCQINVGNVDAGIGGGMAVGALQPNGEVVPEAVMDVSHVTNAVLHMASLPLDVNVMYMTVLPTKMPFVGRA